MKLREIAAEARVSLSSVSLVLNGKPGISPEKREKIARLLRENGYQVRTMADTPAVSFRNILFLKYSKHSYLVNGNPGFVTQIIDAVDQECRKHNYDLLITAFQDFRSIHLPEMLEKPATLGVILLGTEIQNADMAAFSDCQKPMVVVDNSLPRLPFNIVTMHNEEAIFSAVKHLLNLGHRHVGFLANSIPANNDLERLAAFKNALAAYGGSFEKDLVYSIFPTMDGACESVSQLLFQGTRFPSALVANNDSIAIGALRAFKNRGLRIPQDISLVGFDGLPFAALSEPPLTTISVSCGEIGRWAVQILHEQIQGRSTALCKMQVCTRFTQRESTAPYHIPREHPLLLPE